MRVNIIIVVGLIVVFCLLGIFIGIVISSKVTDLTIKPELEDARQMTSRYMDYYMVLNEWMAEKQCNKSIEQYLINKNVSSVAIYGMTELGCRLYDELKDGEVEVICAIDKGTFCCQIPGLKMIKPEEIEDEPLFETVQLIVVTPFSAIQSIKEDLRKHTPCEIWSLKDIISEL